MSTYRYHFGVWQGYRRRRQAPQWIVHQAKVVPQVVRPCDAIQQCQVKPVLCALRFVLVLRQRPHDADHHLRASQSKVKLIQGKGCSYMPDALLDRRRRNADRGFLNCMGAIWGPSSHQPT